MLDMEKKLVKHTEICTELAELYEKKNTDYDDAFAKSFGEYGMAMPCIRLEDKLNRLKALTIKCQTAQITTESIEDTIRDLANYAIMTLVEIELLKEEYNNGESK